MDRTRLDFQLTQFTKALAALDEAIGTDEGDKKSRDSVLLSFVFTFEMAWRRIKHALSLRGLEVRDYAAAALTGAFQAGLIEDADAWDTLRNHRNNVSHAYDEDKAVDIASYVRTQGVGYFRRLLKELSA